ncbi:MAG: choice-of-anchor D domain-containing protein, partial [Candidatus Marinimicrobia bacterium]|nr:choice-of-anchor D domain-containing protein [Candidatus Neomarinimicrobiota bacterium]
PNFSSDISIDLTPLDFDTVFLNESGTLDLTITNNGNAPLQIDSLYTSSDLFTLSIDNSLIETSAILSITYTPVEFGLDTGTAYIKSNDPDEGLVQISLSGFGYYLSPNIELSANSINFGGVMDGLTGTQLLHVYNTGDAALELDTMYCTDNFSVAPSNGTVNIGDTLALEVTFAPDDETSFAGTMTIVAGNDPDEDTLTVSLSGNGTQQTPVMELSDDSLYFGAIVVGQTVTRQTTIYNIGMLDLEVEEITMEGSEYYTTTFSGATVEPNDSVDVVFQFAPTEQIQETTATATIIASGVANQTVMLEAGYYGPVWHVATTGSDETGDGTEQNPFATIQAGIDVTNHGDTVRVSSGTYIEVIDFNGKNISVIGEDRENTIIDGNWNGISVVRIEDVEGICALKEMTIINGYSEESGGGIYCSNASLVLENLIIDANTADNGGGIYLYNSNANISQTIINDNGSLTDGGGVYSGNSNVYFNDVIISNNQSAGQSGAITFESDIEIEDEYYSISFTNSTIANNTSEGPGNIVIFGPSSVSLQSVTIHDNILEGGEGSAGISSSGEGLLNLQNVSIINNYHYDCGFNDDCGAGSLFITDENLDDQFSLSITNSIFWNHRGNEFNIWINNANQTMDINYSNIRGGYDGEQNIEADPLFCDQGNSDFTLGGNSPCVGSGLDGVNMGALDIGCNEGQEWEIEYVAINSENIPLQYSLYQNYPNPFNPTTQIKYDLPEDAMVSITIYDLMGRSIKSLVNSQQTAGYRSIQWNATNIFGETVSAGMYFYSIQAGDFRQVKKMVFLK